MTQDQALSRIAVLQKTMLEHAATADRASQIYGAHMTLFNVAASTGDKVAMEIHRLTMHGAVDSILDSGVMIAQLRQEMAGLFVYITPDA